MFMSHCTVPHLKSLNHFRFFSSFVAVLALLTSVAAASAADDIADPCKLVTAAEVQAVLGAPVTMRGMRPPSRSDKHPARICSFQGQNGKMMNIFSGHRTKAEFAHEGSRMESIAGLGDAAYTVPPGIISFLKGDTCVSLATINFAPSDATPAFRAKMKTLALAAANRL
jgi:hypothetical protein